ncbi:translocation/assembly module TamB domain-containing protein [Falsiroseomonas sp.]|uniref:translocation/assembly module TamB domain-containing protein n=1 Tax=Falsiroseomonas sp. TaxID=2870721 RepID=UPI0034A1CDE7
MRALGWLAGLALLPALLLAVGLLGANTAPGRAAIERLAGALVPGLVLEGLEGPLPGRPGFARLTLADDQGIWLEIEDARLVWSPRALLRGEAHIEALTARRVALHRLPASDTPPDPTPPGPLLPDLPSLPVAIRLDRLEAARIELGAAVLGEATVLRAAASGRLDPWGIALGLEARTEEGGTALTLDATLRPGTGRLQARASLRGEAGGPLSRLAGLGDRPVALDLTLDGPDSGADFTLDATAGPGLGATLAGTVTAASLDRLGLALEGRMDASGLTEAPFAPFAGPIDVRLDAGRMPDGLVDLRTLRLSGLAGVVTAEGRIDPDGARSTLALRAALPTSEVFAPLLPQDVIGWAALEAEAELTGRLDAPRLDLTLLPAGLRSSTPAVQALLGPAPRLTLRTTLGPGATERIELLTLAGQALQAELRGRIGAALDLAFAADLAAPGEAVPGLSGALRLRGTATGPRDDPTLVLEVASDRLEFAGRAVEALRLTARIETPATRPAIDASATGRLAEMDLSLALRGHPEEAGWLRLDAAEATLGPLALTAAGRLHPTEWRAEGEARLAAEDLAQLSALIGQPVAGGFTLEAAGRLEDGAQHIAARLAAPRLVLAGTEARQLAVQAEGLLSALDLSVAGTVAGIEGEARGKLMEDSEGAAHRLDLAALRLTGFGETLRLASPTRLTRRADGALDLAATTLALPRAGTLRAEGRWGPERADLRATLAGVNLAAFAPLVPDLTPSGTVTGEARVTGPVAAPELLLNLRGTGLRAVPSRGLPPAEARVELRRAGNGLTTASAEMRVGPQQRLAATARFPRGPGAALPFEATLDGALDLGPLSAPFLAAGADRITGQLALALRATGTPADPLLGGEARLARGQYRNAEYGIALTDLAGTLRPDGRRLRADLTGRTPGDGRMALTGWVEPLGRHLPVDLLLTATGAQPIASDLARVTLDTELRLAGLLGAGATLSGPVRIRRADIRIPDRIGGGPRSLGPVTERGQSRGHPAASPAPRGTPTSGDGPPITLAVDVSAPRAVFVRGRGLEAELGGDVSVRGRLAAPEITGALELRRGEITLAGKRLEFERGRLAWDGALLPDLALRASSSSGGYTARVDVTGPPTAPEIVFSSVPELPQDEVLARLFFDRPLRELSAFELATIAAGAAGTAGLVPGGGGEGMLGRIRDGLGLDRLAVGSAEKRPGSATAGEEDRPGATLEAGRYVADGVYVGVRQGTEPGTSRVGVRVDLTPRMRLEAETGDREAGNRVGVSWEWQWGR